MFSKPSRATWIILLSMELSRSHIGLMQPWETRYRIWLGSWSPPEVAFEMAQQASFLVLKSAFCRMLIKGGMTLLDVSEIKATTSTHASMIAWICNGDPAVMLEMVQQASFRIPSLGEESRLSKAGRAPEEMMT